MQPQSQAQFLLSLLFKQPQNAASDSGEGDSTSGESSQEGSESGDSAATDTPSPTDTPAPADTAIPTNTPSVPIISVTTNTNCRYGPGTVYDPPVDTFLVGETAEVYGRDAGSDFYYISKGCWVWTNYVVLQGGNLGSVPVMTAPPTPTPAPTEATGPWAGEWETDCGISDCDLMTLTQDGNIVSGTYAGGEGTITGIVSDDGKHLKGNLVPWDHKWGFGLLVQCRAR